MDGGKALRLLMSCNGVANCLDNAGRNGGLRKVEPEIAVYQKPELGKLVLQLSRVNKHTLLVKVYPT